MCGSLFDFMKLFREMSNDELSGARNAQREIVCARELSVYQIRVQDYEYQQALMMILVNAQSHSRF